MSIPDSSLPGKKYSALERKQVPGLLSLNEVLQESLRKAQAQVDKVRLVVRCETLPVIIADRDEMVKLFDELLAMILNHQVDATRLFLFIYCQEDNTDIIDMTLEAGLRRYCIKFHTNVATHENWKLVNSQGLINCKQILSRYNGNLAVNDISSTGCLFSVLLPGKIE
jgi:light-regulated signal transduction histidine kinase (bacteriophytochrome)